MPCIPEIPEPASVWVLGTSLLLPPDTGMQSRQQQTWGFKSRGGKEKRRSLVLALAM